MAGPLHFHFDHLSPYSFLAWSPVKALAARRGVELVVHPVLLAGLLSHWGQRGPAEIAPKRTFTFKDVVRRAAEAGVTMRPPASHPFNPLLALRVSLREVAGADQVRVVDTLFAATWQRAVDVTSPAAVAEELRRAGLDGDALVARAAEQPAKDGLRASTEQAIARGVFGVPTVVVDGELFFGQDRLTDVERYLDGADPVATADLDAWLAISPSATRR